MAKNQTKKKGARVIQGSERKALFTELNSQGSTQNDRNKQNKFGG